MNDRLLRSAVAAAMALSVAMPMSAFAAETMAKKQPTPGQLAARERMHKCSAEWKEAKTAGKVDKDMKWPKFWSACNKRLKGASKG